MTWVLYVLYEPGTEVARYVGCTTNPEKRFQAHRRGDGTTATQEWILSLNTDPDIRVVAFVDSIVECDVAEKELIQRLRDAGHPLLNLTSGGRGQADREVSEETRTLISKGLSGIKRSAETRERMSAWKRSSELCEKISTALKDKRHSQSSYDQQSQTLQAYWTDERRAAHARKISEGMARAKAKAKAERSA
jgi:predicted GIY-YIG superfamily endonuclease